jgi:hypothetical protein
MKHRFARAVLRGWSSILLLAAAPPVFATVRTDASPPADVSEGLGPRRVALVMGVEDYHDSKVGNLSFAADDAEALAQVLGDRSHGGFDSVHLLTGTVSLGQFFKEWDELASEIHSEDLLLVYFAGHGTLELAEGTRLFLLFSDSELDNAKSSALSLEVLEAAIQAVPAHRKVLVVDSCYSGRGRSAWSETTRERAGNLRGPPAPPSTRLLRRLDAELFAAHLHEPAMEDPALGHGVYSWYFIQALKGAGDMDHDGLVDVWEAHEYAMVGTLRYTGGVQTPWLRVTRVGHDDIFLSGDESQRKTAEKALVSSLELGSAVLRIDGKPTVEFSAVSPGWHTIDIEQDGDSVLHQAMLMRRGARVDMSRILDRHGRREIGLGATLNSSVMVAPPLFGHVQGWLWSNGQAGTRIGVGLDAAVGYGSIVGSDPMLAGHLLASAGWTIGGRLRAGPLFGAGALWRACTPVSQLGPMLAPGARIEVAFANTFVSVDPALWFVPLWGVDAGPLEQWAHSAALSATFGWRR